MHTAASNKHARTKIHTKKKQQKNNKKSHFKKEHEITAVTTATVFET